MPRTFAYLRISTTGQTTDDQLQEIAAAGFKVEPRRVFTETVSGNVATSQRRGFTRLLDRLETGDVLVVTKLDRLGRNVMDVGSTVAKLAELGVRVHCLALGGADLTSSTGKLTMNVLNAVAEFERDLLVERTQAGLSRAKSEGKTLGRPLSLTDDQRRAVSAASRRGSLSRPWRASSTPAVRPSCACRTQCLCLDEVSASSSGKVRLNPRGTPSSCAAVNGGCLCTGEAQPCAFVPCRLITTLVSPTTSPTVS